MTSRRCVLALVAAVVLVAVSAPPAGALNDQGYDQQWGMKVIGAKAAWDAGLMGQGVTIAVIDTGVHLTHQDLAGRIAPGRNYISPGQPAQDDSRDSAGNPEGHGTHVAGTAAASIDNGGVVGVAPKATILPIKVLDSSGTSTHSEDVADAIRWAADQGAQVINLSLGEDTQPVFPPSTGDAITYAWSKGSICVFAAGNNFVLGSGFADEPALVVAATTKDDQKAYFSSGVGSAKWGISAPGGAANTYPASPLEDEIFSTTWESDSQNNTYRYLEGTSMAAPHVSGAAAVLRAAGLSPQQTVDRLLATAKDLGTPGRDTTFGAGRLDVAKAVAGLASSPTTVATAAPAPTARTNTTTRATTRTTAAPKATTASTAPITTATTTATTEPVSTSSALPIPTSTSPPATSLAAPRATSHRKSSWLLVVVAALLAAGTAAALALSVKKAGSSPPK